jgi:hypothetical protein
MTFLDRYRLEWLPNSAAVTEVDLPLRQMMASAKSIALMFQVAPGSPDCCDWIALSYGVSGKQPI